MDAYSPNCGDPWCFELMVIDTQRVDVRFGCRGRGTSRVQARLPSSLCAREPVKSQILGFPGADGKKTPERNNL